MVNRRRVGRPAFRALIRRYFLRDFHEAGAPATGRLKKGNTEPSLAAISARKEGPVNRRCAIRDFRINISESRPVAAAPDDPLPRAIIAAKYPIFLAPFPRSRRPGAGVRKKGEIKSPLAARTARKQGHIKRRWVFRDFQGRIMASRRRARRPSFVAIIEEKDGLFLTPLARRQLLLNGAMCGISLYGLGRRYARRRIPFPRRA